MNLNSKIQSIWGLSNIYKLNSFNSIADEMVVSLEEEISLKKIKADNEKGHLTHIAIELDKDCIRSIFELKIINEYRYIEVFLKILYEKAFRSEDNLTFSNWNEIIKAFKKEKVDIEKNEGYYEVFQLKQVNNSLKHSTLPLNLDKKTKDIIEFKGIKKPDFDALRLFYDRVKKSTDLFVENCIDSVVVELENNEQQIINNK